MGLLDWFRGSRVAETLQGGGARTVTIGQVGAAYGVQAIDDQALHLIQSVINARNSGDFNRALSLYKRALALEPSSVDSHNELAATHLEPGNIDDAVREYHLAIQHSPGHVTDKVQVIYRNLANAILKKGLTRSAIGEFRTASHGLSQS